MHSMSSRMRREEREGQGWGKMDKGPGVKNSGCLRVPEVRGKAQIECSRAMQDKEL